MYMVIRCPKCGNDKDLKLIKNRKFLQCPVCNELWSAGSRASIPKLGQKVAIKK